MVEILWKTLEFDLQIFVATLIPVLRKKQKGSGALTNSKAPMRFTELFTRSFFAVLHIVLLYITTLRDILTLFRSSAPHVSCAIDVISKQIWQAGRSMVNSPFKNPITSLLLYNM